MLSHSAFMQSNSLNQSFQSNTNQQWYQDSASKFLDSAKVVSQNNAFAALHLYNRAIEFAVRNNNNAIECQAWLGSAMIRLGLNQSEVSKMNFEKGLQALNRWSGDGAYSIEACQLEFELRTQLSIALERVNKLNQALTTLEQFNSNRYARLSDSKKDAIERRRAVMHGKLDNPNEAFEILDKLLLKERADKRNSDEIETLLCMGNIKQEMGAVKEAEQLFLNAKRLSEGTSVNSIKVEVNNALSSNYRSQNLFSQEIQMRNDNLELNRISNDNDALQKENLEIGNAYLNSNNLPQAELYIQNSVNLLQQEMNSVDGTMAADSAGILPILYRSEKLQTGADAYKRLAEGFLKQNELQKAVEYFKAYSKLQDSADAERKRELATALELSAGFGRDQQRLEMLEQERDLSEKSMKMLEQDRDQKNAQVFNRNLIIGVMALFVLIVSAIGFITVRNVKARRKADKLLALQSLSGQMNPHFIFNALNSVNEYISLNDERAANRYLSSFSKLMRQVMDDSKHTFIPLHDEVEMLRLYLSLEHSRFKDQFNYELQVADDLKESDYEIPPMLVQPYIENAIWHGLRYRQSVGFLSVKFYTIQSDFCIEIEDNGIGIEKSKLLKTNNQKKQNSLALKNIETRIGLLNEIYASKIRIQISDAFPSQENPGTRVTISIPGKTHQ